MPGADVVIGVAAQNYATIGRSMRVLFLGDDAQTVDHLREMGEQVACETAPLVPALLRADRWEYVVSFGYRHILRRDVLEIFGSRAVNLHISLLPYNRGAHPNLWSVIDTTPGGVTIHHIDEGVDTGDIVAQRRVDLQPGDTLRTSYERLQREMRELFFEMWPVLRRDGAPRTPQRGPGTIHRVRDLKAVSELLIDGWDTPIDFIQRGWNQRRTARSAPGDPDRLGAATPRSRPR